MISRMELRKIARGRLRDAEMLYAGKRYDGAIYLCGYAVEMVLKARLCQTLKWADFPLTPSEFSPYQSFKTHNLIVLLNLSGQKTRVRKLALASWSVVEKWTPETRYNLIGTTSQAAASSMIAAVKTLLRIL